MTEIKNCVKRYNYNVVIRSDNALVFMKYILNVFKGKVSNIYHSISHESVWEERDEGKELKPM